MAGNREFNNRRLHSLLGVLPIGIFLIVHLTINYQATKGAEAYNAAAGLMENIPFLLFVETVVIYIPILFHAIYGVYIAFTAKPNNVRFSTFRNWMFVLQRITGVILIIFIAWHVWETRIAKALGAEVNFDMMANIVDNPAMLVFYIVGIVCATFHLSNGLWSFFVSWGITVSPRSQRILTYVTMLVFVAVTFIGVRAILAFTV
ncbi:succinate dehydrogenase cytochrome b558 subunit [Caldibacillus thermolactis]|jgi:succinate dehydrogenase / fumarate reductase, cytochrome b subunit|uniref:Succinate dehydrogenase cytochrome b558 subunit n=1 Tax=Pallidibacillus thermolactis TaxID=251051 RepID=A0ABT2WI61_9BACI|nr:succinate dehydrogenase cytochrome b558 subunit [Pallidibacillus thermolactis]MCU9594661.1 succinate dehydrogenase cytochrome b558 subunit [Pallidibacillus thermolactis]MCU9601279.1 succinate dehydrogenase cytochrome b558 subunit [Pallidibacillus thermolactis subsp. kokeshiiformis]MED1673177.1 succinate dehydrogenase cytochrome b558 subunit [Pallidibacillus thermolactis subsp. kokeshiiformis]